MTMVVVCLSARFRTEFLLRIPLAGLEVETAMLAASRGRQTVP
jgi:hypothetical protein